MAFTALHKGYDFFPSHEMFILELAQCQVQMFNKDFTLGRFKETKPTNYLMIARLLSF